MAENKAKAPIGLRNIHYALLTNDDKTGTTYGTPKYLAPAISANVTPTVNSATLPADDGPLITANSFGEVAVEIGVANIPFAVYAELLGATITDEGLLIDSADDQAPEVALGYERTNSDGSIVYVWLLKGKFRLPSDEATTKQGDISFQTPTLAGTFIKRISDGQWRFRIDDSNPDSEALADSWFTAVPSGIPTVPTP